MRCCPIPPRQAKAHFPSLIGSDTQIAAIQAAISLGDRFIAEGPEIPPVRIKFDKNAECYKGVVQLPDRTKPLRHLIAVSEAFASNSGANVGRILLADSSPQFLWTSLVQLHGLPAVPEWGE